ncbi:MAG TPA: glycine zipper 2TM domain-containing protein [Ramlibacter sp.]|nr:glycine zipper 2TM domain-containing protein [Ramlibacter sp.]
MKRLSLLLLAAAAAAPAFAQSSAPADPVLVENARVRSSTPVYEEVQVPRTECITQTVVTETPARSDKPNLVGAGLGAVAGGLLGHTVGGGNGKTAATAVGAVAGALVGSDLANRNANAQAERAPAEVQNCKTVKATQRRLVGYRVRYEYAGREFESIVRSNPGSTLPVRLSVAPVDTP